MPKGRTEELDEESNEARILSFIVRLWREESNSTDTPALWRGHITSVPGGNRHYFLDVKDIADYITARLKEQG